MIQIGTLQGQEWTYTARVIFIITENQTYSIAEKFATIFHDN
jgi:hypothetical protein